MENNNFWIPYFGNKWRELKKFNDDYKNHLLPKLTNIKRIVEPFCGSSAFSCWISQYQKFEYHINDFNKHLINLYIVCKDTNNKKKFIDNIELINDTLDTKIKYNDYLNKNDTMEAWFIRNSFYSIRPGLYKERKPLYSNFKKALPIDKFLNNEKVIISNNNFEEILEKYKNKKDVLVYLDPPYLFSSNEWYDKHNLDEIYDKILTFTESCKCKYLIVIPKDCFSKRFFKNLILFEYSKKYEARKNIVEHLVISNL